VKLPLIVLLALLVSACARPVVRETVVERPVVVDRQVAAAPLRACSYAATSYSHGSMACQAGYQFRCNDGAWDSTNLAC
jgi:hypothetical protein